MHHVHIISPGFGVSNSKALLYPILRYRRQLRDMGLRIEIFPSLDGSRNECDTLAIDARVLKYGPGESTEKIRAQFARLRQSAGRVYFFDTTDSSGMIRSEVLSHVDKYFKNQVLKDRVAYTKPMYGRRSYTDYYHSEFGVVDSEPMTAPQVDDVALLDKLHISWNPGLANYAAIGLYLDIAYRKTRLPFLLTRPTGFIQPGRARDIAVHTRMGLTYRRETVSWQRQEIFRRKANQRTWDKVGRRSYFEELGRSRLVLAPFGWGEFTYKDYETFITGGLLVKPDMGHMRTWPDFYRPGETMLAFKWDLSDLDETLQHGLDAGARSAEMAQAGQDLYRHYTATDAGRDEVCQRIVACLT